MFLSIGEKILSLFSFLGRTQHVPCEIYHPHCLQSVFSIMKRKLDPKSNPMLRLFNIHIFIRVSILIEGNVMLLNFDR